MLLAWGSGILLFRLRISEILGFGEFEVDGFGVSRVRALSRNLEFRENKYVL